MVFSISILALVYLKRFQIGMIRANITTDKWVKDINGYCKKRTAMARNIGTYFNVNFSHTKDNVYQTVMF